MAFGDWFHQTQSEQVKLQLEQAKLQHNLAMAQMNAAHAQQYQQFQPSSITGLANQQSLGYGPGQIMPVTMVSTSNGLGSFATQSTPNNLPYYVQLPITPKQGDKITVYFDGIKWMETRDCPSEAIQLRDATADHSGFSLKELEAAQSIMEECSGTG